FEVGDTSVKFSGYVKLDTSLSRTTGGDLPTNSLGRDFYLPALVPVGGDGDGVDIDFNPRETRFTFDMKSARGGHDIGGRIEFDFQVTSDGNERVSNSFTPRIRQGYITIDNWLLGQAWSTFQDVGALPDNLDFIGPTEGTVFIRQPMIRYTKGPWQIAIEQPETEITGPAGERILPGDDFAPDFVLRYNYKRDWGHVTFAALARALHVDEGAAPGATDDTTFGFGLSASGKVKVGARDDIRFMATYGDGIGRYVGVNIVNDAAIDADGDLEKFETISGFLSYRHFWTPTLRSNLTGGYFHANNPTLLVGTGVTEEVYSIHANLIATVIPKLDVGVEYIYANRRLDSGMDGDLNRVQFSTKYSF
ncbi:MAG: DcaP family trimeric outer membrane transporter, partial [Pseudomonadota bacterium]